jgi:hypothetical protein
MKSASFKITILTAFAVSLQAATVTWTDVESDHDWGNPDNWSTLALPGEADTAVFPTTILYEGAITNLYVVEMNGDRSVSAVSFSGSGYPIISGPAHTLTVNGNITGSKSGIVNTRVVFTTNATVKCTDNYGNKISLTGGVDSPYGLAFSGSVNNGIAVSNGIYSVSNTTINASTSFRDCVISNSLLTIANTWSDSNGNRTGVTLFSTVFTTNTVIATDKNAGGLTFNNQGDIARSVATVIRRLEHRQGSLSITPTFYGGTNLITVQEFICDPGAFVKISNSKMGTPAFNAGVNAGLIIPGAVNTNGTYKPNFMYGYYLTKVNAYSALESCSATTDYTVLPVATYDPTKMYRQNTVADITLTQDSEVWAWLVDKIGDIALLLGEHDMTIGSGNMVFNGTGVKSVASTGGKLVIGGDDFIVYAAGTTGSLTFSAPLAWRKPAGSTVQYPSLIFSGTGLPEVIFSGVDEIGDYNALNAEAGQAITSIIFAGPSDRTFHGTLTGRNRIYHRGSGTLTFSGADDRRSASFWAESGTTVLAHNDAPQVYSVTNGAVCIVADGITPTRRVYVYDGGIFCMAGNTASVGYQAVYAGGRIEGGAPGEIGTFKATGDFQPYDSFAMGLKISQTTNSLISLSKFIIPPVTGGATITVRVEDLSNGARDVSPSDVFTVATATSFTNTSYPMNFAVENASPTKLDTSAAQVTYNSSAKTITISGISSMPKGTVVLVR